MKISNLIAIAVALLVASLLFMFALRPPQAAPLSLSRGNEMPAHTETIVFGMGCFWGAEKRMAAIDGVLDVESGYANGESDKTSYQEVLATERRIQAGQSQVRNHAEVVKVRFDPKKVELASILAAFWENHDPTQADGQGNDIGSNYRSAIYTTDAAQLPLALQTRDVYQAALTRAGFGQIVTEIEPLKNYVRAEDYHQDYLVKNPDGYCGLGGTGVKYGMEGQGGHPVLDPAKLNAERQLVVFEAETCPYCEKFKEQILDHWQADVPVARSLSPQPPTGWSLEKALFATPTIVLFEKGREVARYTGYNGEARKFWQWLGFQLLSPEQRRIAFEQGTEIPGSGSHLDEKRPGTYVDPISGAPLFRSDAKFASDTGWPSFFNPVEGALELREDFSHGMRRTEVISKSSGIHLGHVFDDGPPPTGKRYCINGNVLKFVPDAP
ncbi:peptide methionine sulfoxide reductase [Lysobacteraceae bacterium NML120232]|nr:peptide methionine sulfoxide reductase [Xanthomonadaceae bacterium NML08-0793]PJK10732.1 peptide methionine sulfoxide reductase [Xanthomonadaceae bacterium NML120232]